VRLCQAGRFLDELTLFLTGPADHLANLTGLPAHIRHAGATAVRS